jgi:hypothetical protein
MQHIAASRDIRGVERLLVSLSVMRMITTASRSAPLKYGSTKSRGGLSGRRQPVCCASPTALSASVETGRQCPAARAGSPGKAAGRWGRILGSRRRSISQAKPTSAVELDDPAVGDLKVPSVRLAVAGFMPSSSDPSLSTNAGITLSALSQYLGHQATIDELKALTPSTNRDYSSKRGRNATEPIPV